MFSYWLINQENKHQIVVTSSWFYYLPTFMMHGYTNIKPAKSKFISENLVEIYNVGEDL
jgi:hypothetical protein